MNANLDIAIQRAFEKFISMSNDDFKRILHDHEDGDIARALFYSNALETAEIEMDAFSLTEESCYLNPDSTVHQVIDKHSIYLSHQWTMPLAA
jgi:hypothetical protein